MDDNRDLILILVEKLNALTEILTPSVVSGLTVDDIVDALNSTAADKCLSANQGKALNDMWQGLGICTVDDLLLTFAANSKMSDGHDLETITDGVVSSSNVYSVVATMGGTTLSPFYNGAKTNVYFLKPEVVDQQVQYTCNLIIFYTKS